MDPILHDYSDNYKLTFLVLGMTRFQFDGLMAGHITKPENNGYERENEDKATVKTVSGLEKNHLRKADKLIRAFRVDQAKNQRLIRQS